MFRSLLLALVTVGVVLVTGGAETPAQTQPAAAVEQAAVEPAAMVGMVVGDSITVGQGDGGWRTKLIALADSQGVTLRLEPYAVGQWSSADALPGLAAALLGVRPDFVLIAIGTNDDPLGVEGRYDRLIKTCLDVSSAEIFPSWIQYSRATPTAIAQAAVNDAIYRRMLFYGYFATPRPARHPGWADMQDIPPTYLDGGGVHPTSAGNDVYAHKWWDTLAVAYGLPPIPWTPNPPLTGHRP